MEKLKMHTPDIAEENFRKLAQMFPNAITETVNENGEVVRAIDADILRQEISCEVVEGRQERYQFTWPDKRKSVVLANRPIAKTLRLVREKSVGRDGTQGSIDTENIYIEGDNLDALKLLRETYLGKVKMIYIDPPYNTGNDFVYEDDFTQSTDEYITDSGQLDEQGNRLVPNLESNGRFHTDWLNMLYPRLKIARDFLTDDGVIFISIDDNEQENCKKLCNEIFGEYNLVAIIPWQSRASIQNDTDFSVNHEYIIVYAKNRRKENRRLKESNYTEWHKRDSFVCKPLPLNPEKFSNPDNDPRGLWKADPFDAPHIRPNLTYPITNPITGEQHLPPRGRHWRISSQKFVNALEDGRIVWTNNGLGRPQLKVFYEEKKEFGSIDNSWFSAEKIGTSTNGTKEQMKIFDGIAYFDTPKPTSLLLKLITLANVKSDDIIMDFFSGSATTAHAVMQLNTEDNGNRKFIMVQLPEVTPENSEARKAGYETICDIGEERIRRVGKQLMQALQKSNSQKIQELIDYPKPKEKSVFISTHYQIITDEESKRLEEEKKKKYQKIVENLDIGFRVFYVGSSNMKNVYYTPDEWQQSQIDLFADNIKSDRTPEDLLFQVMLDLGIVLSEKIEETEIDGKKVFSVAGGYLIACFDSDVTENTVKAIAQQKPFYAVFRDSGMANDSVATNFEQIFETYSPETVRRVL